MAAGMLDLPVRKFVLPNIIGCLLRPPLYFLLVILSGAAIDIPAAGQSGDFKSLLLAVALLVWLAAWLCWRWWRSATPSTDRLTAILPRARLHWMAPLVLVGAISALAALMFHPLMPIYLDILGNIVSGYH